jgi:hypothetical protein
MASKNSERLEEYKSRLRDDGLTRLYLRVCPELAT